MVVAKLMDEMVHSEHCATLSIQMLSYGREASIIPELVVEIDWIAKPTRL